MVLPQSYWMKLTSGELPKERSVDCKIQDVILSIGSVPFRIDYTDLSQLSQI